MSDVREQLKDVLRIAANKGAGLDSEADAILERFDVIEKPVITDEALGRLMDDAQRLRLATDAEQGAQMRSQLTKAGLGIVRMDDAE